MPINVAMKKVNVDFIDTPPFAVDTSPFNHKSYNDVKVKGHYLTDLNLIHCASIHYQSKFGANISRRLRYTLDTIEPSLLNNRSAFYFDDFEESESQKITSEVIGVGFSISLFQKILDVNFNCFNRIPVRGTSKRCDYEINKNGNTFILESKGRKKGLNAAKQKVMNQKTAGAISTVKYGCISMIKRNTNPVSITVVDPPNEDIPKSREDRILDLLIYYTKALQLSGFYILANHLNQRIYKIIENESMISTYENQPIDYQTVVKFGSRVEFPVVEDKVFTTFITRQLDVGLKKIINYNEKEYLMVFGMDPELVQILEDQNYPELLEYSFDFDEKKLFNQMSSIHNDGTVLSIVPKEKCLINPSYNKEPII